MRPTRPLKRNRRVAVVDNDVHASALRRASVRRVRAELLSRAGTGTRICRDAGTGRRPLRVSVCRTPTGSPSQAGSGRSRRGRFGCSARPPGIFTWALEAVNSGEDASPSIHAIWRRSWGSAIPSSRSSNRRRSSTTSARSASATRCCSGLPETRRGNRAATPREMGRSRVFRRTARGPD